MPKIRVGNGLVLVALLTIWLVIATLVIQSSVARMLLGLPFLVFSPGYVLVLALFPRKDSIDGIERAALSMGLSIIIVPLVGLLLNYTVWGIRLQPLVFSIALFIILTSIVAWIRWRKLAKPERYSIELRLVLPESPGSIRDRVVRILLVGSLLATLGTLGYVLAKPKVDERFTEFYIVGPAGKMLDYPSRIVLGDQPAVTMVISNYESEAVDYRVEVWVDGVKSGEAQTGVLSHQQQWTHEVTFSPQKIGENQRVEFLLFKDGETQPYRTLHLWIDVDRAGGSP
ncbi:MAG: DUF1616 domain-containing protein [Dehalococcoidia bacterium]|nr:DUF1616 domain-containing protein [Dehalococcoidia bacterium]